MSKTRKALVISNCQVQPLKHALSLVCRDVAFESCAVHVYGEHEREAAFSEFVNRKDEFSFVLSIPLSDDFGCISSNRIVESFEPTPVLGISNLTYLGTQPDITYMGGMSNRAQGPLGPYHSQIAVLGYLMGLSEVQTQKLYCDEIYSALGHYDAFDKSMAELALRDEGSAIPIAEVLPDTLTEGVCFLSHNHPTSLLIAAYVNKIADWLSANGYAERTPLQLRPEEIVNFLASSYVFPIYPEIAKKHNLSFEGSYCYRTAAVGDDPPTPLSLEEFIAGEFDALRQADQDHIRQNYPGVLLMFSHGNNEEFKSLVAHVLAKS